MGEKKVIDLYGKEDLYKEAYKKLKSNSNILPDNKKLILKWLDEKEENLKNQYGHDGYAKIRYYKTLMKEVTFMKQLDHLFKDKKLKDLTKEDIKYVYQGLEKGTIKSLKGNPLSEGSRQDYYKKVFKGGFFKFIGKSDFAKEIIKRRFEEHKEVRFFEFEDFQKMVKFSKSLDHSLFMWLALDAGVEMGAMLQILKSDFTKESDEVSNTKYWVLHVRKEISKKSRQKRDIYIYFNETSDLLSAYLPTLTDDQRLFDWSPRNTYKFIKDYSNRANIKVKPGNEPISPKDFRSSCATYFLKQEWTTDQVKGRLGHSPSSKEIDRYVNYFGLNQASFIRKKKQIDFGNYKEKYAEITEELKHIRLENRKLSNLEVTNSSLKQDMLVMKEEMALMKKDNEELKDVFKEMKENKKSVMNSV
ncbi:MAG: site-specific integrase [Nanoarchaeota archaeon]